MPTPARARPPCRSLFLQQQQAACEHAQGKIKTVFSTALWLKM
jgi:hypothetical protein